jgi:hypothetical protein
VKPTRRQKAIALLHLAEGDAPERAAQFAGMHAEDVAELVSRFSERGLDGVGLGARSGIRVALIRPGVGMRRYRLPEGGTFGDLLSRAGASTKDRILIVDDLEADETSPLHEGAVVTMVPTNGDAPHHAAVPTLQDDVLFERYREILKARRQARARREELTRR